MVRCSVTVMSDLTTEVDRRAALLVRLAELADDWALMAQVEPDRAETWRAAENQLRLLLLRDEAGL